VVDAAHELDLLFLFGGVGLLDAEAVNPEGAGAVGEGELAEEVVLGGREGDVWC